MNGYALNMLLNERPLFYYLTIFVHQGEQVYLQKADNCHCFPHANIPLNIEMLHPDMCYISGNCIAVAPPAATTSLTAVSHHLLCDQTTSRFRHCLALSSHLCLVGHRNGTCSHGKSGK